MVIGKVYKSGWGFQVAFWHGEGKSLFYVVEFHVIDGEDWRVIASFTTRKEAEKFIETY